MNREMTAAPTAKTVRVTSAACLFCLFATALLFGGEQPAPDPLPIRKQPSIPTLSPPRTKTITTASGKIQFTEWVYRSAWYPAETTPDLERSTPEAAIVAYVTAVQQGDWKAAQQVMDPESRQARAMAGEARGVSGAARADVWKKFFQGQPLAATRRAQLSIGDQQVAFITVIRKGASSMERRHSPPLITVRDDDGRWWITDAFREHPLAQHLQSRSGP